MAIDAERVHAVVGSDINDRSIVPDTLAETDLRAPEDMPPWLREALCNRSEAWWAIYWSRKFGRTPEEQAMFIDALLGTD